MMPKDLLIDLEAGDRTKEVMFLAPVYGNLNHERVRLSASDGPILDRLADIINQGQARHGLVTDMVRLAYMNDPFNHVNLHFTDGHVMVVTLT